MILLNVPYSSKDEAKSRGALWNPTLKKWYIKNNADYVNFLDWLPFEMRQAHHLNFHPLCAVMKRTLLQAGVLRFREDDIILEVTDIIEHENWNKLESILKKQTMKFEKIILNQENDTPPIYHPLRGLEIAGSNISSTLDRTDTKYREYNRDYILYLLEDLTLEAYDCIESKTENLVDGKLNQSTKIIKEKCSSILPAVGDLNSMTEVVDWMIETLIEHESK